MILAGSAALALAGCQQKTAADAADPNAGLSKAILAWRGDIARTPACSVKVPEGKACQTFEVDCKVEAPLGPQDKGVTAKVVAAMSWSEWNPIRGAYDPASGGALFAKTNGQWVRKDIAGPVNLSTCATS
ncbi:MAG TPA: hypothetical protein VFW47_14530 [Phenylobacterium sp.]|nr:hypothetical protein [Phenylobacterium sp.]